MPSGSAFAVTPLFVYGSLRRGRANHRELRGASFLGEGRTVPRFALVRIGDYPALVAGAESVAGELYTVGEALLAELDEFEGEAYARSAIELDDGRTALTYRLRSPRGDEEPWPPT